jgi:flagella basal body P-ring formation protein FlgA
MQSSESIAKDQPINNSNVYSTTVPFERNIDSISESDLHTDICAVRTIARNSIIKRSQIKKIPLIKKGSTVTATYKVGVMSIEFEAVAQEDGAKNELINIKRIDNDNSHKAQVIDHSTVRIR